MIGFRTEEDFWTVIYGEEENVTAIGFMIPEEEEEEEEDGEETLFVLKEVVALGRNSTMT